MALFGLLCNLPFWLQAGGLDDEAVTSLGAWRVTQGQVPYRDFDTRHSPGSYYTAALGLWAGGVSQASIRAMMLLNSGLLVMALVLVARQVLPPRQALVPGFLFAFGGLSQWPILSYHWMATLAFLVGTWALLTRRWGELGVAIGWTGWYLQTEGVALGVAALGVLAGQRAPRQAWLKVFVGAALSSLLLWSPVLWLAGPSAVWQDSVAAMAWHVPFNHSPYSLRHLIGAGQQMLSLWPQGSLAWKLQSLAYWGVWACKYGLYFPGLLLGLGAGWRRGGRLRELAWVQLVLTLALANRLDLLYQNYLTPLWYVLVLAAWPRRAVMGLALLLFGGQYLFLALDARTYVYPVETPAGRLYSDSPGQAQALNHLFGVARQLTPPGTRTFAYPYAASFYFLSQTSNATRYPVLVPLLYPRSAAQRAARERVGCQVIYRIPVHTAGLAQDYPTVSPSAFEAELQAFDELLLAGYQLQGRAGLAEVWRRSQ